MELALENLVRNVEMYRIEGLAEEKQEKSLPSERSLPTEEKRTGYKREPDPTASADTEPYLEPDLLDCDNEKRVLQLILALKSELTDLFR